MDKHSEPRPASTKWIFLINGVLNCLLGFRLLYAAESWTTWDGILGAVLSVTGPVLLIYGVVLFMKGRRGEVVEGKQL